jgi:ferric-dicitrate binding protein FerR (iron transport regulator)
MSGAKKEGTPAELLSLTAGYCNGTLSTDEFAKLERLLLDDAESRALFRRYLGIDVALSVYGDSTASHWVSDGRARHWKAPRRMFGAAAVAILAAVATLWVVFFQRQASATVIGTLEQVTGNVRILGSDGKIRAITANTPLGNGDTVRTRGSESSTVMAYSDGTRLTLVGNTSVTCGDHRSKSIVVHEGTLAASVQPQPREKPMLLTTPSAQVQVLGTRFQIEALANRTDLNVTEGHVRVVRISDGNTVDVSDGKHAVVTEQNKLLVQDIPIVSDRWEIDFEQALPTGWDDGEPVTDGLPPGSRGGVKCVFSENEDLGGMYRISSNEAWLQGLFAIRKSSHLHVTFKMDNPNWVNVLLVTRTSDPHDPRFSGNYLLKEFPSIGAGLWQTLSVPLAHFERIHSGTVPLEEVVPYKLTFFSDAPDRGLVIDRIWVTPDGPNEVVLQKVE